jgi:iron complex outermembrane receptor protein
MSKIVRIAHPAFVLTASIFALATTSPAFAQQAAEPAPSAAQELPAVEVVAKKKAAPAKKKQATKQAPAKKAAPVQAAATEAAPTAPSPGGPGSGTGPVEDYAAKSSSTATKTDTPLKETPQSISVVGKEQMRDQGVQNLQEALRYMPGVIADGFGYDSRGDYSVVRGISEAYFLDGLRTTYGFYVNSVAIEPYGSNVPRCCAAPRRCSTARYRRAALSTQSRKYRKPFLIARSVSTTAHSTSSRSRPI